VTRLVRARDAHRVQIRRLSVRTGARHDGHSPYAFSLWENMREVDKRIRARGPNVSIEQIARNFGIHQTT